MNFLLDTMNTTSLYYTKHNVQCSHTYVCTWSLSILCSGVVQHDTGELHANGEDLTDQSQNVQVGQHAVFEASINEVIVFLQ